MTSVAHDPLSPARRRTLHRLHVLAELTWYEVRQSYAGTAAGLLWAVLEPLLLLGTYVLLYVVFRGSTPGGASGLDLAVMMFAGLVPWLFFANCVSRGLASYQSHTPLVRQINFPIELIPVVSVVQVLIETLIASVLLLSLIAMTRGLSAAALLLVPYYLLFAVFMVCVASVIGGIAVMLPDLRRIVPVALRIGIFLSPVLYAASDLPESLRPLATINPVAYFVAVPKMLVLGDAGRAVVSPAVDTLVCVTISVMSAAVAIVFHRYVRSTVVDHL